jgi:uncharacterized membrane protein HdeD (DUF308 family)
VVSPPQSTVSEHHGNQHRRSGSATIAPAAKPPIRASHEGTIMIILGIILLVLGFVLAIPVLWTIGLILIVAGAVLTILGTTGRAIGGRKTWY